MDWAWMRVDAAEAASVLLRLIVAYLLALPIGWERERRARSIGLRTFPLVALASAAYLTVAEELFTGDPTSGARVLQGLVAGIGFIGGGAILKAHGGEEVHGTSTAAGIWATGALGASVAYGRLDIAVVIAVLTFATFRWMTPLKQAIVSRSAAHGHGTDVRVEEPPGED